MIVKKASLLLVCLLALRVDADAQSPPVMPPVPRLPQIGLPLPHIGLPPPNQYPETTHPDGSGDRSSASNGAPRRPEGRRHGPAPGVVPVVIFVPIYSPEPQSSARAGEGGAPALTSQQAKTGTLWLELQPASSVQLFVDGYYVGTSDDLGYGLELEAGDHQVELRSLDFEPLKVNVRIVAGQSIRYQAVLTRSAAQSHAPAVEAVAPGAPMTIYAISGCYAGNVPPQAVSLPPGCDGRRVTTFVR